MTERKEPDLYMRFSRTEQVPVIRKAETTPQEDALFLNAHLGKPTLDELERRGFDLTTIRFSIRKTKQA